MRLVAHHYHPVIRDDDIIITADVDAFIMTPDILQPLKNNAVIWIWQHELTQTKGHTFAMSFLGMFHFSQNYLQSFAINTKEYFFRE